MNPQLNYLIAQQRLTEQRREADRARLVRGLSPGRSGKPVGSRAPSFARQLLTAISPLPRRRAEAEKWA